MYTGHWTDVNVGSASEFHWIYSMQLRTSFWWKQTLLYINIKQPVVSRAQGMCIGLHHHWHISLRQFLTLVVYPFYPFNGNKVTWCQFIPKVKSLIKVGVLGWLLVVVLFAPIRGGSLGICFVCWMLLRHCTEALVYSNHPRAAAASSYLAIIFGRIASGVLWFLRSTAEPMQHPHQCWRWCRLW